MNNYQIKYFINYCSNCLIIKNKPLQFDSVYLMVNTKKESFKIKHLVGGMWKQSWKYGKFNLSRGSAIKYFFTFKLRKFKIWLRAIILWNVKKENDNSIPDKCVSFWIIIHFLSLLKKKMNTFEWRFSNFHSIRILRRSFPKFWLLIHIFESKLTFSV